MATYGRTTMTTYKGTQDEVLVLCGDDETNVYHLNGIINVSGAYIFTVWYKSESTCAITFNVFGDEETVESDSTWKKYVHRKNVTSLENVDISITVTPDVDTYFYEAFCVNGRADTSWYPSDLDYDEEIAGAAKTATNYITRINENGIWVTPANSGPDSNSEPTASTTGWRLADALELFKNGVSHFKVWVADSVAKIRVGVESAGHLLLDSSSIQLKSNSGTVVAQFQAPTSKNQTIINKAYFSETPDDGNLANGDTVLVTDIPSQWTVSSMSATWTDGTNTYNIPTSATYSSSNKSTWFRYTLTSSELTIYANGSVKLDSASTITATLNLSGSLISNNYIGLYPTTGNALFKIGNGTSTSSRHDAFVVDIEGNIQATNHTAGIVRAYASSDGRYRYKCYSDGTYDADYRLVNQSLSTNSNIGGNWARTGERYLSLPAGIGSTSIRTVAIQTAQAVVTSPMFAQVTYTSKNRVYYYVMRYLTNTDSPTAYIDIMAHITGTWA